MAPLVFVGTVITHLFGGSVGREGTAIQMSGSLTDGFSRLVRLEPDDRRLMLIAAMAGGFGAVFGVPIAGCVFALEVQAVGRMRYDALVPALSASLVGDLVVRAVGVEHTGLPQLGKIHLDVALAVKVAIAGLAFGLASIAFSELTHGIKRAFGSLVRWPPARPMIGGLGVIGLVSVVGTRDYLGLSLPLITKATAGGAGIVAAAFALKLLFTAFTLGAGFPGGEVTPLFVIGATLGVTMGRLLGVPIAVMAAVGFVAVFAGAANTPLACTVMGVELFGGGGVALFAIACVVSYIFSSHRGIYGTQRIDSPKGPASLIDGHHPAMTLDHLVHRRRHRRPVLTDQPASEAKDHDAS
jgi:H+/Cl- antiporter ClcA